jgi:hypothetical protein
MNQAAKDVLFRVDAKRVPLKPVLPSISVAGHVHGQHPFMAIHPAI